MKYALIAVCLLLTIQTNYAQQSSSNVVDSAETTQMPTTAEPTAVTENPTTATPTTAEPTMNPTTGTPTTAAPTTADPTTAEPTMNPTTAEPTTASPTSAMPTTGTPTTAEPTPVTENPTTAAPTESASFSSELADLTLAANDDCTGTTCEGRNLVVANAIRLECQDKDSCRGSDADIEVAANTGFQLRCDGKGSCRDDGDSTSRFVIDCTVNTGATVDKIKCTGDNSCKGLTFELNGCTVDEVDCEDRDACDNAVFELNDGSTITNFICENEGNVASGAANAACNNCQITGDVTATCANGMSYSPAGFNEKQGSDSSLKTMDASVQNSLISVAVIIAVLAIVVIGVICVRRRQRNGAKVPMEDANELADMKNTEFGEDEENLIKE